MEVVACWFTHRPTLVLIQHRTTCLMGFSYINHESRHPTHTDMPTGQSYLRLLN